MKNTQNADGLYVQQSLGHTQNVFNGRDILNQMAVQSFGARPHILKMGDSPILTESFGSTLEDR